MQLCMVCDCFFDEGVRRQSETREHFGTPCHETETVCPNCGSDDIEDASACSLCGSFVREQDLSGGLCQACVRNLNNKIATARHALLETLTWAELNYIRDEMEGAIEI